LEYSVFRTALGWMAVSRTDVGVLRVVLPHPSHSSCAAAVREEAGLPASELRELAPDSLGTLPERLTRYMEGHRVTFSDEVDTRTWTPFRTLVWEATRRIPYGETRSYSWIAAAIGRPMACRAVGQALHRNPVPVIVPCHRVIGADSSLTGFAGGLGLKERLLSLERSQARESARAMAGAGEHSLQFALQIGAERDT
jgi:methylated-DNA-[protein]-cysteine S-methyltransferase